MFELRQAVAAYDFIQKQMGECDKQLRYTWRRFPAALFWTPSRRLRMPSRQNRRTILSEVGAEMSRWNDARHFVSWAGLAPRQDVTGGKVIRSRTKLVSNRVGGALRLAAISLLRSESYLGAKFRKLRARRGTPKAIKAMARYLGCLIYRMLTHGQEWWIRGSKRSRKRTTRGNSTSLSEKPQSLDSSYLRAKLPHK